MASKAKKEENLLAACKAGNVEAARKCLDQGTNINCLAETHDTPLHYAIWLEENKAELVSLLLSRKANPSARNRLMQTPLQIACVFPDQPAIVESLLKAKAQPNGMCENPLPNRVEVTHYYTAAEGCNSRRNPSSSGIVDKVSALHISSRVDVRYVEMLVDHGADVFQRNTAGFTARALAVPGSETAHLLEGSSSSICPGNVLIKFAGNVAAQMA